MDDGPSGTGVEPEQGQIRTFLIADVRGWTLFTQQRGDEVAAKLAAKFAGIAREVVARRGGEVIELRGDEALAVFSSTRQAVRAAVDLQERFVEETIDDPELPLPVGIGLDAGEAVPVEGGYRGGALNLAARLCGQAKAGEVLASRGVTHLARKVDGVRYVDKGTVRLKNLTEPVDLVRVVPEGADPAERLHAALPAPEAAPRRPAGRILVAAAVAIALAVTAVVVLIREEPTTIAAGAVGLLSDSGSLEGSIEVGELPRGVTHGLDSLWVTDQESSTLVRVDPETFGVDERIPVGAGPTGVTTAEGFVWVANTDDRTISVVDPQAHRVVQTIVVGNGPSGIVADGDRVWVANSVDATVSEIDAIDGRVIDTYAVGESPTGLTAAEGAIWVANERSGTVSRVASGEGETQTVPVGRGPVDIEAGLGMLWVANAGDATVTRIDPSTGSVTSTERMGGTPVALTTTPDGVWVANAGDGSVERIDPETARVSETYDVGNAPQALAGTDGGVWVGVQAAPATHRGGTLRVVADAGLETIDPAGDEVGGLTASVMAASYDGLVSLRRSSGPAGMTVVPDLAVALPMPTDDGRSYTFQLRDGVRFSDGNTLTPGDVVASFERILTSPKTGFTASLLPELVGASNCTEKDQSACDLSRGIVADEAAGTVAFHLARRAPDFLTILSTPNFAILPAGTPRDLDGEPPPGTGPYVMREVDPDGSAVLERNPEFQEWSAEAQPTGFADRIEIVAGVDLEEQSAMVERGEADLTGDFVPHGLVDALERRASDQLVRSQFPAILGLALNTAIAPFDDVDARRAVAFALDRAALTRLAGETFGRPEWPVTCQIIPPNIPGYAPYCQFTRAGADTEGTWAGADPSEAQSLVSRSGTAGSKVVIAVSPFLEMVADEVATTLRDLGYRPSVRRLEIDQVVAAPSDLPAGVDVSFVFWAQVYPSAAEFLVPLLGCTEPDGTPVVEGVEQNSINLSRFCDPDIDRRMQQALDRKLTDPYASARAFGAIDRDLVDLAPLIPVASGITVQLVSERVGNVQANPQLGVLLPQMWIR
ncbi:MAG TPA: ABC transporter substrate-binding protein [Actinomycetota bacterium]|nr:ABC transporter substrate-binding protein [Actinomycetota bacterium]